MSSLAADFDRTTQQSRMKLQRLIIYHLHKGCPYTYKFNDLVTCALWSAILFFSASTCDGAVRCCEVQGCLLNPADERAYCMEANEPCTPNKTRRNVLLPIWHRKRYTDLPLWCYTRSCMLQMIRLQQHISCDTANTDCECAIRWPERGVDAYCPADGGIASRRKILRRYHPVTAIVIAT